jgi:SAM-dependent methyltransferase
MLKKFKNFRNPVNIFLCVFSRIFLFILSIYYKFDKWHVTGSYYCKPYKKQLIEILNNLKLTSVLEIGCGLGDIINRVKVTSNKYAYDTDLGVINAAKLLSFKFIKNNTKFFAGSFGDVNQKVSAIIMINWTHNLSKKDLYFSLKKIIKKVKCKYIIVDGINKNYRMHYKYCHGLSFWKKFGKIYLKILSVDSVRKFYIIEIIK